VSQLNYERTAFLFQRQDILAAMRPMLRTLSLVLLVVSLQPRDGPNPQGKRRWAGLLIHRPVHGLVYCDFDAGRAVVPPTYPQKLRLAARCQGRFAPDPAGVDSGT
jgi:hypothetical protein